MKKFLTVFALCGMLVLASTLAVKPTPPAHSAASLGNPDPMSKACASNSTRRLGNFCATNNGTYTLDNLVITNTCTALDYTGGSNQWPSSTRWGRLYLIVSLSTTNAVGLNFAGITFYSDNACATPANGAWPINVSAREEVAGGAALTLWQAPFWIETNLATDGKFYYKILMTKCGSCAVLAAPVGYYD